MKKMIIISPNFTEQRFRERWIRFSEKYIDYDIYLFTPDKRKIGYQKEYSFGKVRVDKGEVFNTERCHGIVFKINYHRFISWTSKNIVREIQKIKPDIVYYIGLHNQESIVQIIRGVKKLKNTKVILFSMRGPQHVLRSTCEGSFVKKFLKKIQYVYEKTKQTYIFDHVDAICCHYPDAKKLFEKEGFSKPIFIQTQIGVNSVVYKRNYEKRSSIRKKYNINESEFVFGCAVRFASEKGVSIILKALQKVDAKLLLMGAGNEQEENRINQEIEDMDIRDKVIKTGFINGDIMADYWNAVDCAIHVPYEVKNWVETFSLAVVQAMSVGLPVIGSDSGSIPYQIGCRELIIPEKDSIALTEKMNWIIDNPEERSRLAKLVHERTIAKFDILNLNDEMYKICESLFE